MIDKHKVPRFQGLQTFYRCVEICNKMTGNTKTLFCNQPLEGKADVFGFTQVVGHCRICN